MVDVLTQRRSKEIKQRSNSLKVIRNHKEAKGYDNSCTSSKQNDIKASILKPQKEYNKVDYELSNHRNNSKTLNEQSEYIKTLYKKYLGKENQVLSDKKSKVQMKFNKNVFHKEDLNYNKSKNMEEISVVVIKNNYTQENDYRDYSKNMIQMENYGDEKRLTKESKSKLSVQKISSYKQQNAQQQIKYKTLLNENILQMIGNPRSSFVRCLKNICRAKNQIKSS